MPDRCPIRFRAVPDSHQNVWLRHLALLLSSDAATAAAAVAVQVIGSWGSGPGVDHDLRCAFLH